MSKLRQQLSNDSAMAQKRKWDYLLGEDSGSISSSSSFKNKFQMSWSLILPCLGGKFLPGLLYCLTLVPNALGLCNLMIHTTLMYKSLL